MSDPRAHQANIPPAFDYLFELGVAVEDMTNVEDPSALNMPPHPWEFRDGAESFKRGDGYVSYDGYPQATWHFSFLSLEAWDWLMAFFSANVWTALVYVRTKDSCDDFTTWNGLMHRPKLGETGSRGVAGFFDVTVEFTHLVAVT